MRFIWRAWRCNADRARTAQRVVAGERRGDVRGSAPSSSAPSAAASSKAWQPPCPRSGVIAWAASPSRAIRPTARAGSGATSRTVSVTCTAAGSVAASERADGGVPVGVAGAQRGEARAGLGGDGRAADQVAYQ